MLRKRGCSWYYDFMIKGVRYRGAIPEARTKAQAEKAEMKQRLDVYEGKYGEPENSQVFADFIEQTYMPWAKLNKRTWDDDRMVTNVLCDFFAGKTFAQITPMLVEKFKKERREGLTRYKRARQPATVNRELAVLSKIFTLAIDAGAAYSNPCLRVRKLRMDNARNRYLSAEEETSLMKALENAPSYMRAIVTLAINTGMRRGEILNLRWVDVDFARGVIYVRQTKTGKDRVIPMNALVREALEGQQQEDSEYVFVSPRTSGRLVEIKKAFRAACNAAGLHDFRFHDLRHTAATKLADAGADAFTIAAILGHSTIQMSARYTHATDEAKRRAVERIGQAQKICLKFVTKAKGQAV